MVEGKGQVWASAQCAHMCRAHAVGPVGVERAMVWGGGSSRGVFAARNTATAGAPAPAADTGHGQLGGGSTGGGGFRELFRELRTGARQLFFRGKGKGEGSEAEGGAACRPAHAAVATDQCCMLLHDQTVVQTPESPEHIPTSLW